MPEQHSAVITIEVTLDEGVYWPSYITAAAQAGGVDADDWMKLAFLLLEATGNIPGATINSIVVQPELA